MTRQHALFVLLAASVSCGGGSTAMSPLSLADIVGTYPLTQYDSQPLPASRYPDYIDPNVGIEKVVSGQLVVRANGTGVRTEVVEATKTQFTSSVTYSDSGAIAFDGHSITLTGATVLTGDADRTRIYFGGPGHSRMYLR
jgi:hypothetical protein